MSRGPTDKREGARQAIAAALAGGKRRMIARHPVGARAAAVAAHGDGKRPPELKVVEREQRAGEGFRWCNRHILALRFEPWLDL